MRKIIRYLTIKERRFEEGRAKFCKKKEWFPIDMKSPVQ